MQSIVSKGIGTRRFASPAKSSESIPKMLRICFPPIEGTVFLVNTQIFKIEAGKKMILHFLSSPFSSFGANVNPDCQWQFPP